MTERERAKPRNRLFYLDNLRIYLIILVILHHAALAYGYIEAWPVRDPAIDATSPIFLDIFNLINQTYFMSAFFLLAGYFTPRSLERKGFKRFIAILIQVGLLVSASIKMIYNGWELTKIKFFFWKIFRVIQIVQL